MAAASPPATPACSFGEAVATALAPAWPSDIAPFRSTDAIAGAPDTTPTTYDDGTVQQRPRATRARYRRTVTAELRDPARFRTWAEAHAGAAFVTRLPPDGLVREVRVEGGPAAIRYRQERAGPGAALWIAEMVLEDAVS